MLKLRHFLKPFLVGLLLAIVLLFIQAICELNLPNYMSKIVNVGIQQGGVEESSPKAISQDGYTFITSFMDDDERAVMERSYQLVSGDALGADGKPYSATFPKAAEEQVYVLKQGLTAEERAQADAAFGSATWTMVNFLKKVQEAREDGSLESVIEEKVEEQILDRIRHQLEDVSRPLPPGMTVDEVAQLTLDQMKQDAADKGQTLLEAIQEESGDTGFDDSALLDAIGGSEGSGDTTDIQTLDFAQIYQFQPLLDILPQEWLAEAHAQAAAMDDSLKAQSGMMLVAGFYRELGCDMTAIEINYILYIGLMMLLITAVSGVATILVGYLSSRIGAGVARNMRKAIFTKVTSFSHAEFDRFSTASLITRSTNDVTVIQMMLTMGIRMVCYAPIMGIGGVFMALGKSVSMSWIIGVAAVVLIGIMLVLFAVVMPKFRIMQTLIDRLNLVARESLNGLMVIRAFSRTGFEEDRFEVANKKLTQTNLFVGRAMTFMMPVMMLFMNGLTILIIWVGSHQVAASQMQVGDMMAYMQYVMQIMMSFMFIAMLFVFIPRATVSSKRINEVLDTKPSIVDPAQPRSMDPAKRGLVEFRDVTFKYEGAKEEALSHIDFTAKPGQTTALIGSTGSGKSTIINLIPRFYDATEGAVRVGGVDVRELTQEELRSAIGYVPQQSMLMAGTVESNICYGSGELSLEDLEKVAEVSQALEFIKGNEEGFDLPVSQGGSSVSGGQRQRLSIARALAVKPDIYLFDDSFSALDFTTDAALRKALAVYTSDSTLIIIAQRVSTIMDADQIFVIDKGRIVGSGTHKELLASCVAYKEIASSQLSERELLGRGGA
ncbi:MAG: ABC transporter ATP-binding protein [Coriobacteriia bacterium]|nr:ABC transporter ATP-binding protein [Coriobacteriia bacterium]